MSSLGIWVGKENGFAEVSSEDSALSFLEAK